ncbi:MAG: acyl-CoA thioesterase [Pseudomonadota bacterium]
MKTLLALVFTLAFAFGPVLADNDASTTEEVPKGALMIRTVPMPADTNPYGTVFGGWILGQMDIAGSIIGTERAQGHVVTVGVDKMSFLKPIHAGDAISIYADITETGRTSITVSLETWVQRDRHGALIKAGEGIFTYVLIDANGVPKPLP